MSGLVKPETEYLKQTCRLCYTNVEHFIGIYNDVGELYDCEKKIHKYLYLQASKHDDLPKNVCLVCLQHLETFHKFYEKVNDIQKRVLKDKYNSVVLKAIYHNSTIIVNHDEPLYPEFSSNINTSSPIYDYSDTILINSISDQKHPSSNKIINPTKPEYLNQTVSENKQIITEINVEKYMNTTEPNLLPHENLEVTDKTACDESSFIIEFESNENFLESAEFNLENFIQSKSKQFNMTTRSKSNQNLVNNNFKTESEDVTTSILNQIPSDKDEHKETCENNSKIDEDTSPCKKRKRGRPKRNNNSKKIETNETSCKINTTLPEYNNECEEGQSENELPARDSDNEDWPAPETLNNFPERIIENGILTMKGKPLMELISKFYKLECDLCPIKTKPRFRYLKQLFNHYNDEHNEIGYITCCQTKFSRYPAILMHMARHIQPDAFKCHICGYMVTRPRFLSSHLQTHLPVDEKPFACDQCSRRFCWKGALQIHQISHQPAEKRKQYVCHMCGKVYDTPAGLSTHKKAIHSERVPESHVCHFCAKSFASRTGLNEHMSTIHQPSREKTQVQCTDCGKWLMNNRCLKSHMILHSSVQHECRICDYKTKKPILLKRHLLTQHSNEKPFTCPTCGKTFKLKRALTVHVEQHSSKAKTYKCTFCDRVFASLTNFYTHRKNMHPVELSEMKKRESEEKRKRRIAAGIEVDNSSSELLIQLEGPMLTASSDAVDLENFIPENIDPEYID